ncbi:unnamed protein product [Absidia cylindrospora]
MSLRSTHAYTTKVSANMFSWSLALFHTITNHNTNRILNATPAATTTTTTTDESNSPALSEEFLASLVFGNKEELQKMKQLLVRELDSSCANLSDNRDLEYAINETRQLQKLNNPNGGPAKQRYSTLPLMTSCGGFAY